MDTKFIKELLERVATGTATPTDALERLRSLPFDDVGCAKHDSHRVLRNGFTEVIYCEYKTPADVLRISEAMIAKGFNVFGTRVNDAMADSLESALPACDCDRTSRTFRITTRDIEPLQGRLAIACGGTADIPVAEEAWRTAQFFGIEAQRRVK